MEKEKRWKKKEILLFGAVLAFIGAVLMIPARAMEEKKTEAGMVTEETVIASGAVTNTVTWKVTEDDVGDQTLVIGGTGPMADYRSQSEQPWQIWKPTLKRLVIEDGVTRIGNNTMYGLGFEEVQIGTGVESIGKHAFAYGTKLESIYIPGNVKVLEANAFVYHRDLRSVTLEEGVEVLEHSSLGCEPKTGAVLHIPASLKRFDDLAVWMATEYTVDEENPYFMEVDGVLYNKEFTALVDFPKMKPMFEYRVPEAICEIKKGSVHRIRKVNRMYIPSTVQVVPAEYMFQWSDMEEIYFEDGVPVTGNSTFAGCTRLVKVRLPENMPINKLHDIFNQGCNSIESVKIPSGVERIESFGSPTKALSEIIYDAKNAAIRDNFLFDRDIRYSLVVGESVDSIPEEFKWMVLQADQISFLYPNQFTVEAGAFGELESPMNTIEGRIYIDHQGIFYQLNEADGSAKIIYCQGGQPDVYISGVVSPVAGEAYKVTAVGKDAWKQADHVKTVTFEKPEQIKEIAPYGFANCTGLQSVNGYKKKQEVTSLFVNGEVGARAFYNTSLLEETEEDGEESGTLKDVDSMPSCKDIVLEGTDGASDLILSMESEGRSLEWKGDDSGNGSYQLLTGDTMTILAGAGNKEAEDHRKYRVYFQKTGEDGSLSVLPGQTYTFDGQMVECYGTEDPLCVYIEFAPSVGKTLSIPVTAVYPSPVSKGGEMIVWAMALEKEEAQAKKGQILLAETGAMRAEWMTVRDDFLMTKTSEGKHSIPLRGTEEGDIIPESDLNWKIVLNRAEDRVNAYGNDYVDKVLYRDKMDLPKGISWQKDVISAIKNREIRKVGSDYYAGSRRVFRVGVSGGQLNLSGIGLSWEAEEDTAVLQFTVRNMNKKAQMNTNTVSVLFFADAFVTDLSVFDRSEKQVIKNHGEAVISYEHSGNVTLCSEAEKTITSSNGSLKLSQNTVTKPYYFGEDIDYEIILNNPGAMPYIVDQTDQYRLREVLSPYVYMEPEEMEKMFREEEGKNLSIMISGIEPVPWTEKQGVYEGTVYLEHGGNSGVNLKETADRQLLISWNEEKTGLQVICDGHVYEEDTLGESLRLAGFALGRWTEYTLYWTLNEPEEFFTMRAGETRRFRVYGRAKDTFQMLSEDWPGAYPTDAALTLTANANVINSVNSVKARAGISNQVIREAYIRKQAFAGDKTLKDGFNADDGTAITYMLELRHYGEGSYENLPMVDEMYGAQALLVSVKENPHLENLNLRQHVLGEEEYYVLTEGTYRNVRIGGSLNGEDCIAAEINVVKVSEECVVENGENQHSYTGLHTTIHWNFASIPEGNYRLYLTYQALVDQSLSGTNVYSLGNVIWMNHRENSRIYGSIWGGGSMIDFYKDIVTVKGKDWQGDELDTDGYSLLSAGDQVTYRLTLRCKGDGQYDISGSDIADCLPDNKGLFQWEQGKNITLTYESTHPSTRVEGLSNWKLEDSWNGVGKDGIQYLLWPEETSIHFEQNGAAVYIYVTLTYPEHTGKDSAWTMYQREINGSTIENTFYVYQFPVNVSHHLREEGQILLQKGVYGSSYGTEGNYKQVPGRNYYNNRDSNYRHVIYYLTLYNGGNKRWYLNDIYDIVPKGFTMKKLISDANLNKKTENVNSIMTQTDFSEYPFVEEGSGLLSPEPVQYRSANIQWRTLENGRISFRIGAGEGNEAVSYDEQKQQYYLNHNEAIVFGYLCEIGLTEATEDKALNIAMMRYEDYPRTGTVLVDSYERSFEGAINEIYGDRNDGESQILAGADVKNQYNIIDGDIRDSWILSETVQVRGEIIPGVTKYTESYTSAGSGLVTEYENAVGPHDMINWRVRLHNSGTLAITDYTVEDVLPKSYVLSGNLRYEIFDCYGKSMKKMDVLTVSERSDDTVSIINNNSKKNIPLNGGKVSINISGGGNGKIAISKTENGNERITLHFSDYAVSIPEGGYMDLYLSSYNPTNQYKNTVYTNQASLIPNKQTFYKAGQGSIERGEEGRPKSVKNSSPVTVSFGYATDSHIAVSEKKDKDNYALSTDPKKNYILLSDRDGEFTYHLRVANKTDKGMEKLVLINNLPERGDTSPFDTSAPRQSEFDVCLAENPNVKVIVKTKEGEIYELGKEEYVLEYTDKISFTEDDWNGSSVGDGWFDFSFSEEEEESSGGEVSLENPRAFRIIISDKEGTLIPAKSEVTVTYDCKIKGEAQVGQTAWNSFGYHYKLTDLNQELEAMPLPVGIKIPELPILKKYLTDRNGDVYPAEKEEEFTFVLYEGTAISMEELGQKLDSEEALTGYLKEKDVKYHVYTLKVQEGKSESDNLILESADWIPGKTYTIVELNNHPLFQLKNVNGLSEEQYSFVYEKDKEIRLSYTNKHRNWSVELFKTDESGEIPLVGARFGLYSPREEDGIHFSGPVIEKDGIDSSQQVIEKDGQIWYLMSEKRTDASGKIIWDQLCEDKYYILELEAPDGYERKEEGWTLYSKHTKNGKYHLHVTNKQGKSFPHTGGIGMGMFVAVGTVLSSLACVMKCDNKNKGQRKRMISKK